MAKDEKKDNEDFGPACVASIFKLKATKKLTEEVLDELDDKTPENAQEILRANKIKDKTNG